MTGTRWLLVAVVASVALWMGTQWDHEAAPPDNEPPVRREPSAAAPTPEPASVDLPQRAAPVSMAKGADDSLSKGEQVRAWTATGDPVLSLQAYELIRRCLDARAIELTAKLEPEKLEREPPTPQTACGNIDAGQISSRLNLARAAARAGVPGALQRVIEEGPAGDSGQGYAQLSPPEADAWWAKVETYVQASVAKGDVYALQVLALRLEEQGDPERRKDAWVYWQASNEMALARTGRPLKSFSKLESVYRRGLTEREMQERSARAHALVAAIRQGSK